MDDDVAGLEMHPLTEGGDDVVQLSSDIVSFVPERYQYCWYKGGRSNGSISCNSPHSSPMPSLSGAFGASRATVG